MKNTQKPDEHLTPEEIADSLYPDIIDSALTIEEITTLVQLMPGTGNLKLYIDSLKASGKYIDISEDLADGIGVNLETVLELTEEMLGDPDSDEAYVDLLAEKILSNAIEGRKYLIAEGLHSADEQITLEDWTCELDDAYFEDIKKKNPMFYSRAKLKAARMLSTLAIAKKFSLSYDLPSLVAMGGSLDEELEPIIEILAKKVMHDSKDFLESAFAHHIEKSIREQDVEISSEQRQKLLQEGIEAMRASLIKAVKDKLNGG